MEQDNSFYDALYQSKYGIPYPSASVSPIVEPVVEPVVEPAVEEAVTTDNVKTDDTLVISPTQEKINQEPETAKEDKPEPKEREFRNEVSKDLYDAFQSKELSKIKDILDRVYYDANKLDPHEIAVQKIKNDNPDWTDEDIADELWDKYSVGKKPLTEEDKELLDDDQIKAYEKELKKGEREFKKLVSDGKSFLNSKNKVDVDFPEIDPKEFIPDGYMTEDKFIENYSKQAEENNKQTQEQWQSIVNSGLKDFDKSQKINIDLGDDGGVFDFTYNISDDEFNDLKTFLSDYSNTTASDSKYVTGEGDNIKVDVTSMFKNKMFGMLGSKILKSAIKEGFNKGKDLILNKTIKNADWSNSSPQREVVNSSNFYQQQYDN